MICKGLMPFASAQQALGYAILSDAAAFTCFVADDQAGGWVTVRIEPRCAVVKRPGLRIATGGWVALHIEPRRAVVKRPGWRTATVAPEYFMDFGELIPFPARPGWDPFCVPPFLY